MKARLGRPTPTARPDPAKSASSHPCLDPLDGETYGEWDARIMVESNRQAAEEFPPRGQSHLP